MIARDIVLMTSLVKAQIFDPIRQIKQREESVEIAPDEVIPRPLLAIKL